jgi:hypothetical protein
MLETQTTRCAQPYPAWGSRGAAKGTGRAAGKRPEISHQRGVGSNGRRTQIPVSRRERSGPRIEARKGR